MGNTLLRNASCNSIGKRNRRDQDAAVPVRDEIPNTNDVQEVDDPGNDRDPELGRGIARLAFESHSSS